MGAVDEERVVVGLPGVAVGCVDGGLELRLAGVEVEKGKVAFEGVSALGLRGTVPVGERGATELNVTSGMDGDAAAGVASGAGVGGWEDDKFTAGSIRRILRTISETAVVAVAD